MAGSRKGSAGGHSASWQWDGDKCEEWSPSWSQANEKQPVSGTWKDRQDLTYWAEHGPRHRGRIGTEGGNPRTGLWV